MTIRFSRRPQIMLAGVAAVAMACPALAAPAASSAETLATCGAIYGFAYNSPEASPADRERLKIALRAVSAIVNRTGQDEKVLGILQAFAAAWNHHPDMFRDAVAENAKPCGELVTAETRALRRADEAERALLETTRQSGVRK
jgi:hypothetical protein